MLALELLTFHCTVSPLSKKKEVFVQYVDLWQPRHGYPAEHPLATCSAVSVLGCLMHLSPLLVAANLLSSGWRSLLGPLTCAVHSQDAAARHWWWYTSRKSSDRAPHMAALTAGQSLETAERDQLKRTLCLCTLPHPARGCVVPTACSSWWL